MSTRYLTLTPELYEQARAVLTGTRKAPAGVGNVLSLREQGKPWDVLILCEGDRQGAQLRTVVIAHPDGQGWLSVRLARGEE